MENAEFIDHPDVDEILGTEAAAYEFIEKDECKIKRI